MKKYLAIATVAVWAAVGLVLSTRADEPPKEKHVATHGAEATPPARIDGNSPAPSEKKAERGKSGKKAKTEKSQSTPAEKPATTKPAAVPAKPAEKPAKKEAKAKEPKTLKVVRLTIKGDFPEGPVQPGLFGELQTSLGKLIERLDEAAADKAVAAVWLRIEDLELGRGKIHELRGAIARIRKASKPVYAELTTAESSPYLLAAACDQVFMPSAGVLILPGVRAEVTFYKGLLDKLGLEFDALQMGKYKGAAEPLTRKQMSPPLRESLEAIVDDVYEQLTATIAADRHLKDYQVKTLIDQGLFTAAAAKKAGLVDEVLYADQFEQSLAKRLGADKIDLVTNYKKKQVDTDFSGLGGLMKLMELFSGGKASEKAGTKPKIAVVYAVGPIVEGKSGGDLFGEEAIGSTTMIENLRKAAENPKVVAVVLRIDSPGGSATASDLIWRETVRIKKPLVASMGDVAGSGGYYIAMGARKIVAEPGTLTGSIGVIGGKLVTRGLYDKIGLTSEVLSRGKLSGAFSSNQPFTPDERKVLTEMLADMYGQFVSKAAQGRKMSRSRLDELAQGRVYTGRMAKGLGLVDELGTLQDAVVEAKRAAGLKPDAEVDLLILPQPKTLFEQLFGDSSLSGDMDAALPDFQKLAGLDSAMPEVMKILRQTRLWRQLLREPTLLWMPYALKVR
ncbi:MAG: signal peptide peptidase SppA [Thermoguttaceae bacterium]|jgi:protease-4